MSITDELREYAGSFYLFRYKDVREKLDAIADRIDAEHDAALSRKFVDSVLYGTKFVTMPASELAERYIELPKDADGETIHTGDLMVYADSTDDPFEVIGIGNGTLYYVDDDGIQWTLADTKRHYHEPTVEDVLQDLLDEAVNFHSLEEEREAVAEYAAKLRLAGE